MATKNDAGKTLLIAGLGKMGSAIARALTQKKWQIIAYDPAIEKFSGVRLTQSFEELIRTKAPLLLAVKPDQIRGLLCQISDDRLVVSIAAGVGLEKMEASRKTPGPIIRVMPNTPFQVGEGISVFTPNSRCTKKDIRFAHNLLSAGGKALQINDEEKMHAVTALSGSGPAYVFLFLQALEDAGVYQGLSRSDARLLAKQTVLGSAILMRDSQLSPQERIHEVTSPGGTTIAGIRALKAFNFEEVIQSAVQEAANRSRELAEKNELKETQKDAGIGFG